MDGKKLSSVFSNVNIQNNNVNMDTETFGVCFDTRKLKKGEIFFALDGENKGDIFAIESIAKGAVCVVSSQFYEDIPCIQVADTRKALGQCTSNFYDNIEKYFHFIGVVGTNGKTTTTAIITHILRSGDNKVACIGTLGADIEGERYDHNLTTPDITDLYRYLLTCKEKNINYIVMEISAHAIYYKKVYPIVIDICVFTNCTQDHLDFFKDMETYKKVKESFFSYENVRVAVVNIDGELGQKISNKEDICCVSYGLYHPSDVFAIDITHQREYCAYVVNAFEDILPIKTKLLGEFNIYNALAGIAVAKLIGIENETVVNALQTMEAVEGRFNIINSDIMVIIDYAHTPDSLKNILVSIKDLPHNHIITVFGCGGDRDKSKRPLMGEIGALHSDLCILTSDNPRYELPNAIIADIIEGYETVNKKYIKIIDRTKAIEFGIRIAMSGDIVLIAGKGAENYIDEMGTKRPYSDRLTALEAIRRYRNG